MELFIFSFFNSGTSGLGVNISLTCSVCSPGSSDGLLAAAVTSSLAMAFNWISGLILAFIIIISCLGFRVLDNLPSRLQAVANWSCAVSRVSNNSAITLWLATVSVSTPCADWITTGVLGTSSVGSISSNT